MANTNQDGTDIIREQLDVYKTEYERLRAGLSEANSDLESTLTHWSTFDQTYDQLSAWVKDTEVKLKSDSDPKGDLAEKKAHLEKVKVRRHVKHISMPIPDSLITFVTITALWSNAGL